MSNKTESDKAALEVAKHLLEGLANIKDMLIKDRIIGYSMIMMLERPDGSSYTLTQYDAIDVIKLLGAIHLATAELHNVCLDSINNGLPPEEEYPEDKEAEDKDRPKDLH